MARLTIHILDNTSGSPAAGVRVVLRRNRQDIRDVRTNAEGRLGQPLLEGADLVPGPYELLFHVGDYFRARGEQLQEPLFIDVIPVRILLTETSNYHVPLLVSRYGFSIYRGS